MDVLKAVKDWGEVSYSEIHEVRMSRWYKSPVFFVGDAAHAMTPHLGQGANSSMVDALVLVRLLANAGTDGHMLHGAGITYDSLRRPFVTRIQRVSHLIGLLGRSTSVYARFLRNLAAVTANILPPLREHQMRLAAGLSPGEQEFFITSDHVSGVNGQRVTQITFHQK
jgi:2-polyprenyl-6-methoxyphenol hydroxylase-like FAD-dependent oxidoreductase